MYSPIDFSGFQHCLGEGGGGGSKLRNDGTTKLMTTGYRYPEHKCTLQTLFSYLNIGQDCLKKWFCQKLIIFLEKINISCALLLIHEVNVVWSLKGYMWSHFFSLWKSSLGPRVLVERLTCLFGTCKHSNVRYLRSASSYGAYFCCLH